MDRGRLVQIAIGMVVALRRCGMTATYATAPVERDDVVAVLTATGTLEPTQEVSASSLGRADQAPRQR